MTQKDENLLKVWPKIVKFDKDFHIKHGHTNIPPLEAWIETVAGDRFNRTVTRNTVLFMSTKELEVILKEHTPGLWANGMLDILRKG